MRKEPFSKYFEKDMLFYLADCALTAQEGRHRYILVYMPLKTILSIVEKVQHNPI
jgi:hypothetical protein